MSALVMSGAPRVELNTTTIDLDPSAPSNQYAQSNGNSSQNLQNSAIKTKDSILESEVRGTRLRALPRRMLMPSITVLSAPRPPPRFPT